MPSLQMPPSIQNGQTYSSRMASEGGKGEELRIKLNISISLARSKTIKVNYCITTFPN